VGGTARARGNQKVTASKEEIALPDVLYKVAVNTFFRPTAKQSAKETGSMITSSTCCTVQAVGKNENSMNFEMTDVCVVSQNMCGDVHNKSGVRSNNVIETKPNNTPRPDVQPSKVSHAFHFKSEAKWIISTLPVRGF
jgi:hypothetical protein